MIVFFINSWTINWSIVDTKIVVAEESRQAPLTTRTNMVEDRTTCFRFGRFRRRYDTGITQVRQREVDEAIFFHQNGRLAIGRWSVKPSMSWNPTVFPRIAEYLSIFIFWYPHYFIVSYDLHFLWPSISTPSETCAPSPTIARLIFAPYPITAPLIITESSTTAPSRICAFVESTECLTVPSTKQPSTTSESSTWACSPKKFGAANHITWVNFPLTVTTIQGIFRRNKILTFVFPRDPIVPYVFPIAFKIQAARRFHLFYR